MSKPKTKRGEENATDNKEAEPIDDASTAANTDVDATDAPVDSADECTADNTAAGTGSGAFGFTFALLDTKDDHGMMK